MKKSIAIALMSVLGCAPIEEADDNVTASALTSRVSNLPQAREQHAAELLSDGRVIVIGGNLAVQGSATTTTVIYDPTTDIWSAGPTLANAYLNIASAPLNDGRVLVVGDSNTDVELVDATSTSFAPPLPAELGYPIAVRMTNGDVLVVGAQWSNNAIRAYLFANGAWTTPPQPAGLTVDGPAATLLGDGRVLVTSGTTGAIFDGTSWTSIAPPPHSRSRHMLVTLPDGRVAAIGDWSCGEPYERVIDAYSPSTDAWSTLATSTEGHSFGAALMLADNKTLLVAGGEECPGPSYTSRIELFDTELGFWRPAEFLSDARAYLSATMLNDGRVLLAGGRGGFGFNAYVSPNVDVRTEPGPVSATYSSSYRAPLCGYPATSCSTGTLVNGRRQLGPEPNWSNTITTCADGSAGAYHSDESIDAVRIIANDGVLEGGRSVTVEVDVWAWSGYTSDKLDLFVASDADAPTWAFVTTKTPTKAQASTMTHTFTLPASSASKLAIRAQFRYGGSATACASGSFNDRDDVVVTVAP